MRGGTSMGMKARLCVAGLAALTMLGGAPVSWAAGGHDGDTIWVRPGTGTISAAVAAAGSGDTLRLRRGVYVDAVSFGAKAISVKGAGQGRTIIKVPADPWATGSSATAASARPATRGRRSEATGWP